MLSFQMKRQFLIAHLAVLLQQRAAQHGFRRQATPAGFANAVAAQIVADQAQQWTMLIEPVRDLLQLTADLVRGEDIE